MSLVDRLRHSKYIGANRCLPCTAVNIAIAVVASTVASKRGSRRLGSTAFIAALGIIYFRGYLVPGTPALTKRYFPERVLRWFDKDATTPTMNAISEIDPEQVLRNTGAVEPCQKGTDLCLATDFQQTWRDHMHTIRGHDLGKDHLMDALAVSMTDDRITVDQHGDAFVASTDDTIIGQWESQAALIADIAAATELSERSTNWADFTPAEIARVLMSLRIFIEACPACNGPVQVEQEVVDSCCRSYNVIVSACQDCDTHLFEIEWNDSAENDTKPEQPIHADI